MQLPAPHAPCDLDMSQRPDTTPTSGESASAALSHIKSGAAGAESRMVDVSDKPRTRREALAEALVRFPAGLLAGILAEGGPKGPVTEVARAAGLLAAKRTGELIPMCHPLGLEAVDITFEPAPGEPDVLRIRCRAACQGPTGVEMEAMLGASLAALTVYDMTKALTKGIVVEKVRLLSKFGGKSGDWRAPELDSGSI
jgi:cyclic pyranopterin phosphate synthase